MICIWKEGVDFISFFYFLIKTGISKTLIPHCDWRTCYSLIFQRSNSTWWSLSRLAFSSAGVGADVPCLSQLCPLPPLGPHCQSLLAPPVPYPSLQFVYPWDTPHCRSWRNPPPASPGTPRARRRSGRCTGPPGGAWASRSNSGCCNRRPRGCSPARASAGSRGPPARRTGSCGGCCWTGRAHGGTTGPRRQLQGEEKVLLLFESRSSVNVLKPRSHVVKSRWTSRTWK